jgi:type IV secretory pathway VirB4 component
LVVIDDYSKYPLIEFQSSTSTTVTVSNLEKIFAMFGIPETVKSDNGPPFNGKEFHEYAKQAGFHHKKITPLWPQANGEVEAFMKNIKKILQISTIEKKYYRKTLNDFLRNYRNTPHPSTELAPSAIIFGRTMKIGIPHLVIIDTDIKNHETILRRRNAYNSKIKKYADTHRHVQLRP